MLVRSAGWPELLLHPECCDNRLKREPGGRRRFGWFILSELLRNLAKNARVQTSSTMLRAKYAIAFAVPVLAAYAKTGRTSPRLGGQPMMSKLATRTTKPKFQAQRSYSRSVTMVFVKQDYLLLSGRVRSRIVRSSPPAASRRDTRLLARGVISISRVSPAPNPLKPRSMNTESA